MSDNLDLSASITTEEPEVAATLSDLRYLVFQGMKGDTGDSAYEEAVSLGYVGTEAEWLASLKGEKGDKGDVGALADLDASYDETTKTLSLGTNATSLAIEDRLSATSANPVQNRIITAALNSKQDKLTAGQNITISGNTISADVDSAEIAANVTDWLDDNVTPVGSAVVVDSSLSVSGAAADAKVTGDGIEALQDALDEYDEAFKQKEWVSTRMETSSSLSVETFSDRSCQVSTNMLTLVDSNGYYSYCFVAPSNMTVAANVGAGYYCIGTLENPVQSEWATDSSGTKYKMGTSPTRYRTADNNLPTRELPLTIAAGTQVVITVNDATIPFVDIYEYESVFIDLVTEEELYESKNAFVVCDLLNTSALAVDAKIGRSGSTSSSIGGHSALQLDSNANYDSYCFFAPKNIVISSSADNNTYYAITTLTDPNYADWQTSGSLLWNNGTAVARVRKSENNLPTIDTPMTVSAGTLVAVTVAVGEMANILIQEDKADTIKMSHLGVASPFIDVEMHSGYFYYYIPTASGNYLRYKFVHFVDASSNADGWVQRVVDLVPHNKVGVLMSVVRDGEWEMAIMLKDRPDFIGTMNHGSEIATIANLYFDGVKTTVTDGTKLSCKEIRVNQKSTMYDPADETTVVGYHYKTHFITADEVRIEQRIEWVTDQTLGISYCGMLPATRGNDYTSSVQVTDHAYDNKTYEEYDCATTTLAPYLTSFTDKGNVFYLRGETSGISMSIECNMENRPTEAFTFLSNAVYYNKVYFAHNNVDYQVSNGDVWKWVSIYKIEYAG